MSNQQFTNQHTHNIYIYKYRRDCKVWITSIHSNKHHDPAFQWRVTWQTADLLTSWDIETPQLWSQLVWLSSFLWSISYLRRCTAAECGRISMQKTLKRYQKLFWHRIMYHLTKTSKIANLGPRKPNSDTVKLSRECTRFSLASTNATISNQQRKQTHIALWLAEGFSLGCVINSSIPI